MSTWKTLPLDVTPGKGWFLLTEPVTDSRVSLCYLKVFVKGVQLLSYTVFDPNGNYTDAPWNYLVGTYKLEAAGDDYTKVQDGEKRNDDAANAGGWKKSGSWCKV